LDGEGVFINAHARQRLPGSCRRLHEDEAAREIGVGIEQRFAQVSRAAARANARQIRTERAAATG
jgi:hypothetical protein